MTVHYSFTKQLDILAVVMIVLLSGSIYAQSYIFIFSIIFLGVAFIPLICNKGYILRRNVITGLFIVLYLFLHYFFISIINEEPNTKSYIQVIITYLAVMLIVSFINATDFKRIMVSVITVICSFSLIVYIITLILPIFGYIQKIGRFNTFLLMNYSQVNGLTRNSGIFWEPGAYQAFLNMSLLLIIADKSLALSTHFRKVLIILYSITIITTFSTTGYILLTINLIFFLKRLWTSLNNKNRVLLLLPIVALMVVSVYLLIGSYAISEKFTYSSQSFYLRSYDLVYSLKIIRERPLLGFGYLSSLSKNAYAQHGFYFANGGYINSVGVLSTIISFGLVYFVGYLVLSIKNFIYFFENEIVNAFIWFIVMSMTESFYEMPLFMLFIFSFRTQSVYDEHILLQGKRVETYYEK